MRGSMEKPQMAPPKPPKPQPREVKVSYAAKTDVGMQRDHNEDYFLVLEEDRLFIVADGMGGHAAGEVASKMAAETLAAFYKKSREGEVTWPFKLDPNLPLIANRLICGVKLACYHIYLDARANVGRKGMGTTIVTAALDKNQIHIAHVGDSRAYRIRGETIERLTRDHNMLEEFKKYSPDMTPEEEKNFAHRNVLNRALGVREAVEVDIQHHALVSGDRFVLCSDGLSGPVDDQTILGAVLNSDELDGAVAKLIEKANDGGGQDNVTAMVIGVD